MAAQGSAQVRPVILSGGAGTRLWPLSRATFPKQLLPIVSKLTMLQATATRVAASEFSDPVIVTDEEHRFFIASQLESVGIRPATIILEPEGRNTAAAIALAAIWCLERGSDEPILVMPSDHLVRDTEAFSQAIIKAAPLAAGGALVTFGIQPDSPHVGYGYIEAGASVGDGALEVARFVEKPTLPVAEEFVASGRFYWNAGIFLFRPSRYLAELQTYAAAVAEATQGAMAGSTADGVFVRPSREAFQAAPSISVDYAVMEKTSGAVVVPVDIGWSDVGSWASLWAASEKDAAGNVTTGQAVTLDVRNSVLRSETDATVAAIGIENMVVVVTRDAVLITPFDRTNDVKALVEQMQSAGHASVSTPAQVFRPWGSYERMDCGERFQTKRLIVNPGASLSLQMHHHRSEHWIVVKGTAEVTIGNETRLLQENESTYIPAGTIHRLANPGRLPLHLIEVQCGPYLGEDDIVRVEDRYGRSTASR